MAAEIINSKWLSKTIEHACFGDLDSLGMSQNVALFFKNCISLLFFSQLETVPIKFLMVQ